MVPEQWKKKLIGEVCNVHGGFGFPHDYQGHRDKPILFAKVGDMNAEGNEKWIQSTENTVDDLILKALGARAFPSGCTVFPKVGAALLTNKRRLLCRPTAVDNNVMVLEPKHIEPEYLYYWTHTVNMAKLGQSGALPSVNQAMIKGLSILLPPEHERLMILQVLQSWDSCIQNTAYKMAMLEQRRRGLAQKLLTGKRRFSEFVKSKETVKTKYGLIPKDWPQTQVGELACEVKERNGHDNDTAVLSCTKYDGLVDSLEYFGRQVFSDDTSNYKVVRRGQFAYATNHIEEGSIGLLVHRDVGLVSPMYTVFETTDRVHAPFLYALFKTPLYLHLYQVHMDVSVNRRGGLRWLKMAVIPVALPGLPEQKKIAATLATADREIDLLRCELDLLRKQKRGLLQKLLTGVKRVKGA